MLHGVRSWSEFVRAILRPTKDRHCRQVIRCWLWEKGHTTNRHHSQTQCALIGVRAGRGGRGQRNRFEEWGSSGRHCLWMALHHGVGGKEVHSAWLQWDTSWNSSQVVVQLILGSYILVLILNGSPDLFSLPVTCNCNYYGLVHAKFWRGYSWKGSSIKSIRSSPDDGELYSSQLCSQWLRLTCLNRTESHIHI